MRRSSFKLYGFGVPLALIVGAACGMTELAMWTGAFYLMMTAASLGAPDAFSRSAAKLMSTKKVMGGLITALLLVAVACVGLTFVLTPWLLLLGAILTGIRCIQELFASQSDMTSAWITDSLAFIALAGGLLIPGNPLLYCCMGTGATFVISALIAAGFSRREWPKPNAAIFKEIPAALGRTLLYPALFAGFVYLKGAKTPSTELVIGYFAGQILLEAAKSTFRRDKFEAAGLKTGVALSVLIFAAGMFALGCFWYPVSLEVITAAVMTAGACALLMYGPLDLATVTDALIPLAGAVLTAVGITPAQQSFPNEIFIGPAVGLILCSLMFREWAQMYRQARARRIRKKAIKMSRSR